MLLRGLLVVGRVGVIVVAFLALVGARAVGVAAVVAPLQRLPAPAGGTRGTDAAEASGIAASGIAGSECSGGGAVSEASAGGGSDGKSEGKSEAKSKQGKQAPKPVLELDALLRVKGDVEVLTQEDWWNARITQIVLERKSARICVEYEQEPGIYGVSEGDETEFVVRQADGIWAYADRIRHRQPDKTDPLDSGGAGARMETARVSSGVASTALACAPPPPAPMPNVKRELMMAGVSGVSGVSRGLVEGLQKGITPPAPMSHAKEDAGSEEAVKELRCGYYPGHPCYWPLFYTRTDGTKLILKKAKEYPHGYKRVRVTHGNQSDVDNARNSWMRDLEKEREERRRLGQPSPGLDVDSNKSSPVVASPSNAPPVLSHNGAVAASSDRLLLAPQVVRVGSSDKKAEAMAHTMSHHGVSHVPEVPGGNQTERRDACGSVSPAVEAEGSDEQGGELRLKVLHALALEDLTKAQLKDKLQVKVAKHVLKELARRVEDPGEPDRDKWVYKLKAAAWQEVQVDTWPEYSEDDRTVLHIRKHRKSDVQDQAPSNARSPAQARASHSPVNLDAPTDDTSRLAADEAGGRGGTLRGAGSQGSAFEDVKGGGRSDVTAGLGGGDVHSSGEGKEVGGGGQQFQAVSQCL